MADRDDDYIGDSYKSFKRRQSYVKDGAYRIQSALNIVDSKRDA